MTQQTTVYFCVDLDVNVKIKEDEDRRFATFLFINQTPLRQSRSSLGDVRRGAILLFIIIFSSVNSLTNSDSQSLSNDDSVVESGTSLYTRVLGLNWSPAD